MPNNLLTNIADVPKDKKLVIFDLDGTLAESKSDLDDEMVGLLEQLLEKLPVAVIGGGKYELFQRQLIGRLLNVRKDLLEKLYLFPTTSTSFYKYDGNEWKRVYGHELSPEQKKKIVDAFETAFRQLGYVHPEKIYGELIEDRGSQLTFSALGQLAPIPLKNKWKEEHTDTKMKIAEIVQKLLPDMAVGAAGFTSIDVTMKGIDKEYGINQIKDNLDCRIGDMLFVGDALFEGGNDSAALRTGIVCFQVKNVDDTKTIIRHLIAG